MDASQIKEVLAAHKLWLDGGENGTRADLRGAVLTDADLRDAVLTRADLRDAVLTDADLRDADLRGADLRGAVLTGAVLSTKSPPMFPWHQADATLPRRVAEAAMKEGALKMDAWHTCETTHCLAGWAIHLSGDVGKVLEATTSPSVAGSILMPSASHLFFSSTAEALAWCKEQLTEETEVEP